MKGTHTRQRRALTGLWRHPDFLKLWFAQTISEFGSRITREGLPLVAVLTLAASPAQLGVLTAATSLPVLIFGLLIGVWVDRLPRRRLMIAADLARCVLLLAIPLAALTNTLSLALLLVIAPTLTLLGLAFSIAYRAYLPTLVSGEALIEGNTKLATTDALAEIGGPSVAGLLIQLITAPFAVLFDALSFLLSAFSLSRIRTAEHASTTQSSSPDATFIGDIRAGIHEITHQPVLRVLVLGMGIRAFFGSFYGTLYSYYVLVEVGLSPAMLGVLVSAGGVGALSATLFVQRMTQAIGLGRTLVGTLLVSGCTALLTPLAAGDAIIAALMLMTAQIIGDAAMLVYSVNEISLRQRLVPNHMLGRANASADYLVEGVAPAGALVAGLLGSLIGARLTLLIAVLGFLSVAVWTMTTPVRRLHVDEIADRG